MNAKMKKAGTFLLAGALSVTLIAPALSTTAQAAKIKLNKTKVYLLKGETVKLKITGTKKKVTWKSSKKKVATVSKKGKVKAKKAGTATITAKVKGKKYKCKIIVETKKQQKARLKKEEAAKKAAEAKKKAEAAQKKAEAERIKQAKALRAYVLDKGAYEEAEDTFYLQMNAPEDSSEDWKCCLYANKENNKLYFFRSFSVDDVSRYFELTIDLTKKGVCKGKLLYTIDDENVVSEEIYEGELTSAYNMKNQGLTLTKFTKSGEDETGEYEKTVTNKKELKKLSAGLYGEINEALKNLDEELLDQAGFRLAEIGFVNWK